MQTTDISPSAFFVSSDLQVSDQQPQSDQRKTVYLALRLQPPKTKTDILPYLPNISKRIKMVKPWRLN